MKRKWFRNIASGLSFTTALFVFQACYGTPQDLGHDLLIEGIVKSKNAEMPIQGIKVSVTENMQYSLTDENGHFSFYTGSLDTLTLRIEDIDSTENGAYLPKDTLLTGISEQVFLDIILEEN